MVFALHGMRVEHIKVLSLVWQVSAGMDSAGMRLLFNLVLQ